MADNLLCLRLLYFCKWRCDMTLIEKNNRIFIQNGRNLIEKGIKVAIFAKRFNKSCVLQLLSLILHLITI